MTLTYSDNDLGFQGPWLPPPFNLHGILFLSCLMTSNTLWALGCYSVGFHAHFLSFFFFMTAFCIGTFAELAPHRWFGLWHILIAMKPRVQLLGCNELHNACAIQCTNKRIFLRPQMTQETDTWKGPHLAECPLIWMHLTWSTCSYSEGWWSVESRSGNHPTILRHIFFFFLLLFGSFYFGLVCFLFLAIRSFYEHFGKQE